MRRILSIKELVIILSLSIVLSQISWWMLFSTKKIQNLLHPDIARSLAEGQIVTIGSLPATLILPLITYLPFWMVTLSIIIIFLKLEKRRSKGSPIHQQTI